jgi:hypothetical protein
VEGHARCTISRGRQLADYPLIYISHRLHAGNFKSQKFDPISPHSIPEQRITTVTQLRHPAQLLPRSLNTARETKHQSLPALTAEVHWPLSLTGGEDFR